MTWPDWVSGGRLTVIELRVEEDPFEAELTTEASAPARAAGFCTAARRPSATASATRRRRRDAKSKIRTPRIDWPAGQQMWPSTTADAGKLPPGNSARPLPEPPLGGSVRDASLHPFSTEGGPSMPVQPPTIGQLRKVAESFGLVLSDEDLASFRGLILPTLASYAEVERISTRPRST
jgi:hypothetical protein